MSVSASIHFMENDNPLFVKSDQPGPVVSLSLTANQGNYAYVMLFFYGKRWNEFLDFMKPFIIERDNKLEMEEMNKGEVIENYADSYRAEAMQALDTEREVVKDELHYEDPNR